MKRLAILAAVAGILVIPASASAAIESKHCLDRHDPIGATGSDGVTDSRLTSTAYVHHTTCRAARAVAEAWLDAPGMTPKTLRANGHQWRRIAQEYDYYDGQFGATQFAPAYWWSADYQRGRQYVHIYYDEEMGW